MYYYDGAKYWDSNDKHNAEVIYQSALIEKEKFENLGYSVILCNTCNWEDIGKVLDLFRKDDVFFSIGINAAGLDLYMEDGKGLYECYDVPHISLNADQPYAGSESFYIGRLRNARCNNLIIGTNNGYSVVKCMEMAHFKSKIRAFFDNVTYYEVDEESLNYERDIDVLHTGRLYTTDTLRRSWNTEPMPMKLRNILNEVADYLENQAVSVYHAFKKVTDVYHEEELLEKMYTYFPVMFNYIIRWRRQKLVDVLIENEVPITMCDASWRDYKYAKKMRILGTNHAETMELYKRAKILVSDLAGFNNVTHGRNTEAISRGVAVVSEYSPFLDEEFKRYDAVDLFNWNNVYRVPEMVECLLNDDNKRTAMARKAFDIIKYKFTPENNAKAVLSVIDTYLRNRDGEVHG